MDTRPARPGWDEDHAAQAGVRLIGELTASRGARLLRVVSEHGPAVLKIATPATMIDPVARYRFAREGRVGSTLRHHGLVETLRHGNAWILLNNLGGADTGPSSLSDHVRRTGPLDPADIENRVGEIADALAYMHARGIVHRDIKPGNLLVAEDGRTMVIDFGAVGFAAGDDLDHAELIGSPAWMAPEQITGCTAHASADVWSLAMVAHFALTGRSAYEGSATSVLRRRRETAAVPFLSEHVVDVVSAPFQRLLATSLSIDPRSRPPVSAFAGLRWRTRSIDKGDQSSQTFVF